jgi:putative colanic acid biosynthesis UDP-glucose lipid carrier transferase
MPERTFNVFLENVTVKFSKVTSEPHPPIHYHFADASLAPGNQVVLSSHLELKDIILFNHRRIPAFVMWDLLKLMFAFFIAYYFFLDITFSRYEWIVLGCLVLLLFLLEYWQKPLYTALSPEFRRQLYNHFTAYVVFILLIAACYYLVPIRWHHTGKVIAIITVIAFLNLLINFILVECINRFRKVGENCKNFLVAGTGLLAKNAEEQLYASHREGYQFKGFIHCDSNEQLAVQADRVLGDLDEVNQYLLSNTVDEIVIALPNACTREIKNVLNVADYHGVRVKFILDYHEIFGNHYKITRYGGVDALNIRQLPADGTLASLVKNSFDRLFAFVALLLLLPVFLVIAVAIKFESAGPVFYFPIRIGRGGKPFKVFKFRSMYKNDDAGAGTLSTQQNDSRITKVGRVLRKYSLDELPQFINVLIGNMSVVGPRPHRRFLNRQLQESVFKYMIRHYVKPGITGWAQVNGWRGPTDTDEQRRQRTMHDLWYIENWSMWLDLKIIFLTIFSKKAHKSAF